MSANHRNVPAWRVISDELRGEIADGSRSAGSQLPTELELVDRYQASRHTVRRALGILVNEGLVSVSTKGYRVRERRYMSYRPQAEFTDRPASPEMDRFMAEHSAEGREPRQDISVTIADPPEPVRKRLGLAEGDLAVVRQRVRYLDGEPYNINDSYYPLKLVQDTEIMRPHDIARGANVVLEEAGYRQSRALDEFYIRMPSPDEVQRLTLLAGTPVGCHICTGYTAEGVPVRVVMNVLPGDRHVVVYERHRDGAPFGDTSPGE